MKAEQSKKSVYFYKGSVIPTKYAMEHNALTQEDFIELLKAYKGKILALTGKLDVQADYRVLDEISSFDNVTISTPEKVNHILRDADGKSNIINIKKEYKSLFQKPISHKIKESIKEWSSEL